MPKCFRIVLREDRRKIEAKPNMDWNTNILRSVTPFIAHPAKTQTQTTSSFTNFLIGSDYHAFPDLEANHDTPLGIMAPTNASLQRSMMIMSCYGSQEKKRRLTADQLESLESSFQEEIKLDPDRKMKLARELRLQPRQVAVWFQNRRARWRAKKIEHLYDVLKKDFDVVTREKQKLQEEVLMLKSMLMEQAQGTMRQLSSCYNTEASCEETAESIHSYNNQVQAQGISFSERERTSGTTTGGVAYLINVHHDNDLVSPYYLRPLP